MWIKFKQDRVDKRNQPRCVAVSGQNVNQRKFFQHQLSLFSPGDGHK